jgi:hypothetical protein
VSEAPTSATVRDTASFEERLREFEYVSTEEGRALWVGDKEFSEFGAIAERYADLFSREQLQALRAEEDQAGEPEARERGYRLRKTCEVGVISAHLARQGDVLSNRELAAQVVFRGETMPLREAQARVAILQAYNEREELASVASAVNTSFNDQRLELMRASEDLTAELTGQPDPVARSEEDKGISLRELARAVSTAAEVTRGRYDELWTRWVDVLLGTHRAEHPEQYHTAYMARLAPLEGVFTKEGATEICVSTLRELGFDLEYSTIRTDLEDRPQKSLRPAVFAADPPAVVHLITRAQGGLQDYQGLLHEAGHAFHFACTDPALPYAFRAIMRDQALAELYAYLTESIVFEEGWHALYFDVTSEEASEHAEATRFLDSWLFRRFAAKLEFELEFWSRFPSDGGTPDGYAGRLSEATGFVYRPERFLVDMDDGFYVADYLRASIRAAQLRSLFRERSGSEWWRSSETGDFLRELFREGLRPSSEEIAVRLGFDPLDTGPLVAELNA